MRGGRKKKLIISKSGVSNVTLLLNRVFANNFELYYKTF
jgi:hypothetical protein